MICKSCQTEIADKAIVCYRCGTPTAAPAARRSQPRPRVAGRIRWAALAIFIGVILLSPRSATWRPAVWFLVGGLIVLAAWAAWRVRRR